MSRGLPYSLLLHLVVLGCVVAWGGYVPQAPVHADQFFRVQLAHPPGGQGPGARPAAPPAAEPEPEPVETTTVPEPDDVVPDLPPKEVPKEREKKDEPKPQPKQPPAGGSPQEGKPAGGSPAGGGGGAGSGIGGGQGVSGTDVAFPFAWYLDHVEGIIARQWNPRQLGFREGSARSCVVHFMIDRAGQVSQVAVVQSSGVSLFDREAVRAVRAARLTGLPPKFPYRALGVTFVFTLESGV
ncbi:MAG TPA: TonB family protein [Candidatus Krumholzibacteria bacterium]|nr:TonB family protein [Candidatus Krumholzibacteria bacterium]HPD71682.1 TonB family protein [Candidatus Krumholzibacteria bacterium]HRY41385.1 TonB family protein [Candidatus Krumholzibacteria bacterium]